MRIALIVSDLSVPPREGLHEQTLLLARGLRAGGHQVDIWGYLATGSVSGASSDAFVHPPIVRRRSVLGTGIRNRLWLCNRERALVRALLAQRYDVVHAEGAAAYGLVRAAWDVPAVIGVVDPQSRRLARQFGEAAACGRKVTVRRRFALLASLATVYLFECLVARSSKFWQVVSDADAHYIRRVHPRVSCRSIPVMLPSKMSGPVEVRADRDMVRVLVCCDFRQPHFVRAATLLLAQLRASQTSSSRSGLSRIEVVFLTRVQAAPSFLRLAKKANVRVIAWVEDFQAFLESGEIFLAIDQFGTGIKNRVVQAMARSNAVIATPAALEGIPVEPGVHAVVANDEQEMLTLAIELAENVEYRSRLGRSGRSLAVRTYGAHAVTDAWVSFYSEIYQC